MSETEKAVFKIFIKGSIQDVWREITKTDERQQCMFNMRLHTDGLKPGGTVRMRTGSGKYTGVVGEILELDPPHRYSHTFKFTQFDDPPCKVTYVLEEKDGGVEFTLICDDVPVGTRTAKEMKRGGQMIVNTLKRMVETGKPSLGVRILYVLFGLMEPFSPKSTLSSNWP